MAVERTPRTLWPAVASWPVALLVAGSTAKLLLLPFIGTALGDWLDTAASIALAVGLAWIILKLLVRLQRRLLWRVRRKLIVSYLFIGFVPVLLLIAFFAVAWTMSVLLTSTDLVRRELARLTTDAQIAAGAVGIQLSRGMPTEQALNRVRRSVGQRYDGISVAVLASSGGEPALTAGPWSHAPVPDRLPSWIGPDGFADLVMLGPTETLVARAVSTVDRPDAGPILVDIPLNLDVLRLIEDSTGVIVEALGAGTPEDGATGSLLPSASGLSGVGFWDAVDWESGEARTVNHPIRITPAAFHARLFGTVGLTGAMNERTTFLLLLAVIGGLFLVIEAAALVTGGVLARSITGAVHALFTGTSRVRRGDFTHRIRVTSGDQLGDLAESFNAMTASVESLMYQAAEKKRLEEELRIARQIQMSLLPRDALSIPGLTITALCRPAREVGGDYYDVIRLGERRLGLLVADVSGKGASAALYMAELKGLILSLGKIYESPRKLLMETNRIMASTLDARSFITMLYAVVDLEVGTLTYARAGHTPLFYASPNGAGGLEVRVLSPDGLVLGLAGLEGHFDSLIEEHRLDIRVGDVAVLFTDGVSEAMNESNDLFGEERLQQVIVEHGHRSPNELREQIVRTVESFVGTADQHDDMTMLLLRIDEVGAKPEPTGVVPSVSATETSHA